MADTVDLVTLAEVKVLAKATGPCITVVVLIPNPLELAVRLKSALRSVQKQLAERSTDAETAGELLAPIEQLASNAETVHTLANSLIVFRSPGVFRHYWMRKPLKDLAVVGERFEIRPLLAAMTREQRFYVLAIGRHHVRLFRSTPHSSEEVRLEGTVLHSPQPDHPNEERAVAGPSVGSMREVVFGPGAENEKEQERFRDFLKDVERSVTKFLRQEAAPLMLAGTEYDVAIYRQCNAYPGLLEPAIRGSLDGQTAQQLHERAWETVSQLPSEALTKGLAEYRKQSGAALLLGDVDGIGKAAAAGRVAGLFLSENAGAGGQPDDSLNVAALQTVLHGGWAFELNAAEMPGKDSVTALLRY